MPTDFSTLDFSNMLPEEILKKAHEATALPSLIIGFISPFSDKSRIFVNWVGATFLFIVIQMLFISEFTDGNISAPIIAFWDFFRASPFLIKPATALSKRALGDDVNITEIVDVVNDSVGNFSY